MKKIIRTLVIMVLAVSVIMPGAQAFAQENTSAEFTYTGSNDSDYKGQSTVVIGGISAVDGKIRFVNKKKNERGRIGRFVLFF